MEWIEVDPIPKECENCMAGDCYNCDVAGQRWVLSEEDELRCRRQLMVRAIERYQRKIALLDLEIQKLKEK